MALKRPEDVNWFELNKVESPWTARSWLESNVSVDSFHHSGVPGLDDVLMDDLNPARRSLDSENLTRLADRVERCEIVLVHGLGSDPAEPLLRRNDDGSWRLNSFLNFEQHHNAEVLLAHAKKTREITEPINKPLPETPPVEPRREPQRSAGGWFGVDVVGTRDPAIELEGTLCAVDSEHPRTKVDLRRSNTQVLEKPGSDRTTPFKHLSFTKPRLMLKHGRYEVPVGHTVIPSAEDQPNQHVKHTVLVPLALRRYTTLERKPADGDELIPGYYVYVFLDGKLWRELKVIEQETRGTGQNGDTPKEIKLQEIDLDKGYGKDKRDTAAKVLSRVTVPVKIGDSEPTIEVALAPHQWSWVRVLAFGGMHEEDPRRGTDTLEVTPVKEKTRKARLTKLEGGEQSAALCKPGDLPERNDLQKYQNTGLVLHLDDPFTLAWDTNANVQFALADLEQCIGEVTGHKHFDSAITAYQLFFNEKLHKYRDTHRGRRYQEKDETSGMLRRVSRDLDKTLIESDILKVEERKELRHKLRLALANHAAMLGGYLPPQNLDEKHGASILQSHPDFVTFAAVLEDYAYLTKADYTKLWDTFVAHAGNLNLDPLDIDSNHDLPETIEPEKNHLRPGSWYLEDVLKKQDGLSAILFPKEGDLDPYSESGPQAKKEAPEEPVESADFRLAAYTAAVAEAKRTSGMEYKSVEGATKTVDKVVSQFIALFSQQWKVAVANQETVVIEMMVRFAKASGLPDLEGMHLVRPGDALGKRIILNGSWYLGDRLKRPVRRDAVEEEFGSKQKVVRIIDPANDSIVGSQRIMDIAGNKGGTMAIDADSWTEAWAKMETGNTYKARGTFAVIPETNPVAARLNLGSSAHVEKGAAFSAVGLEAASRGLPPVLAVFEVYNFIQAAKTANESPSANAGTKALAVLAGLGVAATEASKALLGEEKMQQLARQGNRIAKFASGEVKYIKALRGVPYLGAVNGALSLVGAGIAVWDAITAVTANDDDAAAANLINAAALVWLAASSIGAAAASTEASGALAAALIPLAPWATVALVAVIFTSLIVALVTDTGLEKWAANGPFAKDPDDRMDGDFNGLTGKEVYGLLLSELRAPRVILRENPEEGFPSSHGTNVPAVEVEVYAPGWVPGKSTLDIRLTRQRRLTTRGEIAHADADDKKQHVLYPYECEWIRDGDGGPVIGMRYRYEGQIGKYRYRARARHLTEDGVNLPAIPADKRDHDWKDDPVNIDDDIPGWAYPAETIATE